MSIITKNKGLQWFVNIFKKNESDLKNGSKVKLYTNIDERFNELPEPIIEKLNGSITLDRIFVIAMITLIGSMFFFSYLKKGKRKRRK